MKFSGNCTEIAYYMKHSLFVIVFGGLGKIMPNMTEVLFLDNAHISNIIIHLSNYTYDKCILQLHIFKK